MTLNMRRRPHDKHPTINHSSQVADNTVDENMKVLGERPPGKNAEKKMERKQMFQESNDVKFNMALARMTENRHMCMVERRAAVMKADHDRSQQLELKKKKFEPKIMRLDLVGMNVMQQDYFLNLQREIYKASKNNYGATSISPFTHRGDL